MKKVKLKAFTLAEVLITLGIIGVVAALTIPALMQKTNDKELVSGTLKMGTVLSNALKGMEAQDMTTVDKLDLETFVAKFKTHLKTVNCNTHSVCLADGSYFDYANDNFDGTCTKDEPCLEINADINGKKGPNKDGKDIYTFLLTKKGILPKGETTTCSGLDCTAYVLAEHKLWTGETTQSTPSTPKVANCSNKSEESCTQCNSGYYVSGGTCVPAAGKITLTVNGETKDYYLSDVTAKGNYSPNGKDPVYNEDDYWQGANNVCTLKGMRLPTKEELQGLYTQRGTNGVPRRGSYWSSSYNDEEQAPYEVDFDFDGEALLDSAIRSYDVMCVGN